MGKPFEARNRSEAAKRKLKALATASGVPVDIVTCLANFTWDYDPKYGSEAIGWVENSRLGGEAEDQLCKIAAYLGLPREFELTREAATEGLLDAHRQADADQLWRSFLFAGGTKDYAGLSRFSSFFYLRGLCSDNIKLLEWEGKTVDLLEIARDSFLKLFRGGAIDRPGLAYLWCDFTLNLGQTQERAVNVSWLDGLLDAIESLPSGSGLSDLIKCCKGHIVGGKYFKQEVLQALSYAGVLKVNELPVESMFIPEHRNELSSHFYSNDWTFPLRFWSSNGGSVDRSAVPKLETAL